MAAIRRYLDPGTGDYNVVNGGPENDESHVSQVMLALRMRKGSFLPDPRIGSLLHEIRALDSQAPRKAERLVKLALRYLIERRAIFNVRVTAEVVGNKLPIDVHFKDPGGRPRHAPYTHKVG